MYGLNIARRQNGRGQRIGNIRDHHTTGAGCDEQQVVQPGQLDRPARRLLQLLIQRDEHAIFGPIFVEDLHTLVAQCNQQVVAIVVDIIEGAAQVIGAGQIRVEQIDRLQGVAVGIVRCGRCQFLPGGRTLYP